MKIRRSSTSDSGSREFDEFGKYLVVGDIGVDHVLQAVLADELVETVGGDHQRPRQVDPHALVLVVKAVLMQHTVHKGQSARLTAERTVADPGETDVIVVRVGVETRHHAVSLQDAVFADRLRDEFAHPVDRVERTVVRLAHRRRQRKSPRAYIHFDSRLRSP